jgi:hypothetical protein
MKKPGKQQIILAVSCLASVVVSLVNTNDLEGTEFSGGWLTGPLLSMNDSGAALFVLALIGSFFYPRIAGAIGLASSLLCLPIYLYFIAPVPFSKVFGSGHEFKVQQSPGLHWVGWAIAGVLVLAFTAYVCFCGFAASTRTQIPQQR